MAAKTTLNEKNLSTLGTEQLAKLVMELVSGNAALKRQARGALLEQAGGDALAVEVRKRIATIFDRSSVARGVGAWMVRVRIWSFPCRVDYNSIGPCGMMSSTVGK